MILINLLPPEMRKRAATGISPVFASAIGGGLLVVLALAGFLWLQFVRLPNAERILGERTTELAEKTAKANEVLALEAQIIEYEKRRDDILALINRKVYWARTIDEFANLLNGQWSVEGFRVSVQDLAFAELSSGPKSGPKKIDDVRCSFVWRYKLMGDEDRSGDYLNSFFKTVERSKFWSEQGFIDKPEYNYLGDRPRWSAELQKVIVEGKLDWQRVKIAAKPATPPAAQGK